MQLATFANSSRGASPCRQRSGIFGADTVCSTSLCHQGPEGHPLQVQSLALWIRLSNEHGEHDPHLNPDQPQSLGLFGAACPSEKIVEKQEKAVQFDKGGTRRDIETDEATFDMLTDDSLARWPV